MNLSKSRRLSSFVSLSALAAAALCATSAQAQFWQGPYGPFNRIDYMGHLFNGNIAVSNDRVRFDVADGATADGTEIAFHAFIGTPANAVRTTAIWGETDNPLGRALQGFNFATTGPGAGIWAESASAGTNSAALRCRATATTGPTIAGYLDNASTDGVGLYATSTSALSGTSTPVAVWGNVTSSLGYAGYFTGGRSYFEGSVGIGTPTPQWPLTVTGATSQIVSAMNTSTNSNVNAVKGVISATVPGQSAAGVFGSVDNANGNTGIGVWGNHGGSGIGVYGTAFNPDGFSFFGRGPAKFMGAVDIVGAISKSSGTFKIDHPQDPANKYLYHSFVESPDMKNIYDGTTTTDADGYATITLPPYCEALNRDFRYQLTVTDENAPDLFTVRVVQKMKGNTFVIKTFPGGLEVSWQVTGIRQDAWANAHRVVDEVEKEPGNKGKYLHPELFGAPASAAIDYNRGSVPQSAAANAKAAATSASASRSTPVRAAPVPTEAPLVPLTRQPSHH